MTKVSYINNRLINIVYSRAIYRLRKHGIDQFSILLLCLERLHFHTKLELDGVVDLSLLSVKMEVVS